MNKCFRIRFTIDDPDSFISSFVQKHARELGIEGTAQRVEDEIKIVACGQSEAMESFIDLLHTRGAVDSAEGIEIEPFLKEKDYRNVFRIIE